jgi:hypothetical protein
MARPSLIQEKVRAAVINQSWEILHKLLFNSRKDGEDKGSNIPFEKKVYIATEIAKKSMPTKLEGDVKLSMDEVLRKFGGK